MVLPPNHQPFWGSPIYGNPNIFTFVGCVLATDSLAPHLSATEAMLSGGKLFCTTDMQVTCMIWRSPKIGVPSIIQN